MLSEIMCTSDLLFLGKLWRACAWNKHFLFDHCINYHQREICSFMWLIVIYCIFCNFFMQNITHLRLNYNFYKLTISFIRLTRTIHSLVNWCFILHSGHDVGHWNCVISQIPLCPLRTCFSKEVWTDPDASLKFRRSEWLHGTLSVPSQFYTFLPFSICWAYFHPSACLAHVTAPLLCSFPCGNGENVFPVFGNHARGMSGHIIDIL